MFPNWIVVLIFLLIDFALKPDVEGEYNTSTVVPVNKKELGNCVKRTFVWSGGWGFSFMISWPHRLPYVSER